MTDKPIEDARTPESAARQLRDLIDELNDRSLDDVREGARQGAYHGNVYGAPDNYKTQIVVTRGEFRRIKELLAAVSRDPLPPAPRDYVCEVCGHEHHDGEPLIHRAVVTDQPGCSVAASCAIEGCRLWMLHEQIQKLTADLTETQQQLKSEARHYQGLLDALIEKYDRAEARLAAVQQLLNDDRYGDEVIGKTTIRQALAGALPQTETEKKA